MSPTLSYIVLLFYQDVMGVCKNDTPCKPKAAFDQRIWPPLVQLLCRNLTITDEGLSFILFLLYLSNIYCTPTNAIWEILFDGLSSDGFCDILNTILQFIFGGWFFWQTLISPNGRCPLH